MGAQKMLPVFGGSRNILVPGWCMTVLVIGGGGIARVVGKLVDHQEYLSIRL